MTDGELVREVDGRLFVWKRTTVVFSSGARSVIWVKAYLDDTVRGTIYRTVE